MEINSKEDLLTLLTDLQGQLANMQETIDKLSPVEEKAESSDEDKSEENKDELSEDDVDEIDQLLQKS